ncbi:hypothetical protein EF847_02065 [Actinobacteria bacterium YIM 96077]|uniref:NmrA-like domain-containing protein n=1 Tax=Phytoactinopolyspora halophila TaxID=1981511 RepID=A0A329QZW4_9ACTN|nr:NmrA family NAD(P)-binding protein [Phytoactinopolyspora halophila]AYY11692.1 hypothetical protein EF847_02065 [Actinobacteria bacterium YIM 96077]RAW17875.1 hypothetical protein DPM12_03215 [Phytoactinopolyspora halophila]
MYVIAGATGHVGGQAARTLLDRGEPVRVLVRSAENGEAWSACGADVALVDLSNRSAFAEAVRGARGVFVLLPATPPVSDFHAEQRQLADAIADGIGDSAVPHVTVLSSIGADLSEGTGPLVALHHFENRLRKTGAVLSVLRSYHFHEKVETVLGSVREAGIYPNFGASADVAKPMVATRDIGDLVAETLLSPPVRSEIIDVEGPWYTERQVAETLARVLDKPVDVVNVPRDEWVGAMAAGGVPPGFAEILAELHDAEEHGLLQPKGDRTRYVKTELADTMRRVLEI